MTGFALRRGFEGIIGAANGITGVGDTVSTLWNLGSRERERRRERNDRINERNEALQAYKDQLNSTSLSARFMQGSSGKEARRQRKEMERALTGKYGKGYKNLDPVEKGKIDVAEAQAANISEMKDTEQEQTNILKDILETIKNVLTGKKPSEENSSPDIFADDPMDFMGDGSTSVTIDPSGKPRRVGTGNSYTTNGANTPNGPSMFDTPNVQLPVSIGPGGPTTDDDFDPEDITPETDRTAATVGAGVGDALTKTLFGDKSKFAPLLKLGSSLGGLIAPFVGKGVLLLGGALLLYNFFKDPSGFINTIVDAFRIMLSPLFNWLKDEGYAPQAVEEEALYKVNEISTGGQDLKNAAESGTLDADAYTSAVFDHFATEEAMQEKIRNRNWFEKMLFGNEKTSAYNMGSTAKARYRDFKTEAQGVLWLEKQGMIDPLDDSERTMLEKYASLSDSALKATAWDKFTSGMKVWSVDGLTNTLERTKYTDDLFGTRQDVKDNAAGITYDEPVEDSASSGGGHRATGAANISKNDTFYLHKDEGVLTASANHLFGGAETTAGLLNAYARNGSLNDDKSALSTILNTVGGTLSPNMNIDSMMTPMYGTQNDMIALEEYMTKVRESSLDVDNESYWKFNNDDSKKYGPMAKAMFNIIRFTNYPSRLITNAIKDIGNDLDDSNIDVKSEITTSTTSTSASKTTIGGKIKNTISGVIGKVGDAISGLFEKIGIGGFGPVTNRKPTGAYGGSGDSSAKTTGGAVSIGMTGNDFYKFPSASVAVSDFNPARQLSSDPKPRKHNGLDLLSMAPDKSVRSTTNGVVAGSGDGGSYGNVAIVQDEYGMYHMYAHMKNRPNLKNGQQIKAGDVLGTEGNTGQSFGAHVHYEVGTGFNGVGSAITGTVHPAEYLVGYNSGSNKIMATPLENYVAGSFWNGTSNNAVALSPSGVNVSGSGTTSSKKSGDLLSMLYAPLIEYNSTLKSAFSGGSSSTGVTYGSTLGEINVSDLSGSETGEKIWNGLISAGYTPNGAAGIMGNLRAESGLNPINLQDTYEGPLGHNDASYTAAVDSGKYPANKFINDAAGYGLAQWTYWTRKKKMLEKAKAEGKSVGDLGFQLNLLVDELKNSYTSVDNVARNPKASINEVSDTMLVDFENPAVKNYNDRRKFAQEAYAAYGGSAPDDDIISNKFKTVNGRMTPSAVNGIVGGEIISILSTMVEQLTQIASNTGKTAVEAKAINNKVSAQPQSNVSDKPTPTDKGSNSAMYDVASRKGRSEKTQRNYNIAKAIAKGY
jgi:murein DD-endopeptidase MepM/ murein hydrolase activator NlpD